MQRDLQEGKQIWLRSLYNIAKKTRVKVQRRNAKRLGQGKRDNDGAGGFVGIGAEGICDNRGGG